MIIPDHKKVASIIVASLKPKSGEMEMKHPHMEPMEPKAEDEMDDNKEGLKAIAREAMDALKADDEHGFAMAMHDFFEMCDSMPHKEGPHEDDESEDEIPSLLGPR